MTSAAKPKRKPRMSKAQVEFMREHLPAYLNWLKATGQAVGIKMQPWQKVIVESLIRKKFLTEDGHVTADGQRAYEQRVSVIVPKPRSPQQLLGKTADLIIVDDPVQNA